MNADKDCPHGACPEIAGKCCWATTSVQSGRRTENVPGLSGACVKSVFTQCARAGVRPVRGLLEFAVGTGWHAGSIVAAGSMRSVASAQCSYTLYVYIAETAGLVPECRILSRLSAAC